MTDFRAVPFSPPDLARLVRGSVSSLAGGGALLAATLLAEFGLVVQLGAGLLAALVLLACTRLVHHSGSLFGLVGWCGMQGALLGSVGGTLAFALYGVEKLSEAGTLTQPDQLLSLVVLCFGILLLGWLPGLVLGLSTGGLLALGLSPILRPLARACEFPAYDTRDQLALGTGLWLAAVGAVSLWLGALVAAPVVFLGLGVAIEAWVRLLGRQRFVSLVRAGQVPRLRVARWEGQGRGALPLLSVGGELGAGVLLYQEPSTEAGPYRAADREHPIALLSLA